MLILSGNHETNWEADDGEYLHYVMLEPNNLVFGSVPKRGQEKKSPINSDLEHFLVGWWQDEIFKNLGEASLKEIHAVVNKKTGRNIKYFKPPTTLEEMLKWVEKSFPIPPNQNDYKQYFLCQEAWNETMRRLAYRMTDMIKVHPMQMENMTKIFDFDDKGLDDLNKFLEEETRKWMQYPKKEEYLVPAVMGYFARKIMSSGVEGPKWVPGKTYKEYRIVNMVTGEEVCPYEVAREAVMNNGKLRDKFDKIIK